MSKGIPKNGINTGRFKKGQVSIRKGIPWAIEQHIKFRAARLGKKVKPFTDEHKKKLSKAATGKPHTWAMGKFRITKELREKMNFGRRNMDRSLFKKRDDRKSQSHTDWLFAVRERDSYQCKMLNDDCDGILEAHHILSWREYPELRYDINNGILLCKHHHPRKYSEEKRLSPYFTGLVTQL